MKLTRRAGDDRDAIPRHGGAPSSGLALRNSPLGVRAQDTGHDARRSAPHRTRITPTELLSKPVPPATAPVLRTPYHAHNSAYTTLVTAPAPPIVRAPGHLSDKDWHLRRTSKYFSGIFERVIKKVFLYILMVFMSYF